MQGAQPSTESTGWSKRTRVVVGVSILVVLLVWFAVLTVDYVYPGALYPPGEARQAEVIAALTNQVRQQFGADLDSVNVRYGRDGLTPTFFGTFTLKDVPLEFSFRDGDQDLRHYADRTHASVVDTSNIGGEQRFASLARAFHNDFPAEKAMAYVPVFSPGELPAALRPAAERPGPSVVVYGSALDSDPSQALGVYSWDPEAQTWQLVHRGPITLP